METPHIFEWLNKDHRWEPRKDISNHFVKWLDEDHRWELRRVINAAGVEMYTVYDSKTDFEEGSCYPDQVDGMIRWAMDNIPFWREMPEEE